MHGFKKLLHVINNHDDCFIWSQRYESTHTKKEGKPKVKTEQKFIGVF